MSSYGVFAQYYDTLTRNVRYDERAAALHRLIGEAQPGAPESKILLDLGCGTGSLSLALSGLGYDVIGVDCSEEMLSEALEKKYADEEHPAPVQFLRQDMRTLDLYGSIDVTVCMLDSLNHLESEADLRQTFSRVHLFSNPGALFLFDVNTAYKHRQVLGGNAFVFETEAFFCVWQNTLRDSAPDYPVTVTLDFFEQTEGAHYLRSSEEFTERIFPPATVEAALSESGFTLLRCLDGDTFTDPLPETQRLLYVARTQYGGQRGAGAGSSV